HVARLLVYCPDIEHIGVGTSCEEQQEPVEELGRVVDSRRK
nr:hypothetical protein [Tanacetum cinerariifolium]